MLQLFGIRDARDIINKKRPAEQANYSVTDSQHREKSRRVEESSTWDGNNNIHIKKKTTTISPVLIQIVFV
jgi:hypothetical protein